MTHNRTRRERGRRAPQGMAGVSMIEVLISIVILAFGLLGIAAMQMLALKNSQGSLERSQATIQTYAILDAMRANHAVAIIGGYNLSKGTCSVPSVDEAGTLASKDLNAWMNTLKNDLGASACAHIECKGDQCMIEVQWDDSKGASSTLAEVTTRTVL